MYAETEDGNVIHLKQAGKKVVEERKEPVMVGK
jgi:hypothetical protein